MAVVAAAVIPQAALAIGSSREAGAPATQRVLVRLAAAATPDQRQALVQRNGGTPVSYLPQLQLLVVSLPAAEADNTLRRYQSDASVAGVEKEQVRTAAAVPDDPAYPDQWALPRIGWDSVYAGTAPAGAATVAVLDTGVDVAVPDLAGRTVAGFSALAGGSPTVDANGHGTRLATIAAAAAGDGAGVAGVGYAGGVKVMPVQVLGADGTGADADVIAGLTWAADNGADVILMGFSNPGFSASLQAAVDYAWSKGAVLVAATGNGGSTEPTYPAGDAKVVGVSGTDTADALWSGSNSGAAAFLGAPGVDIAAVAPGGARGSVTGTSASAAVVAGAAALLVAADPSATPGTVVGRLARTADAAGTQAQTGNGRVNVARALADTGTAEVVPAGAAPLGDGGPFVGPYVASAFKADVQGKSNPACTPGPGPAAACPWQTGNLAGWQELELIPMRLHFTGGGGTKTVTVEFDHTNNTGTTPGIQDLFSFTPGAGISITSGPTLATPSGGKWSYTLGVNATAATSDITFFARLSAGAHNFPGSSLAVGGNDVGGTLQISKPAAKPGSPDLTVTKSGPATAAPGSPVTYTLDYSNKATATSSATGVQLTDTLPAAMVLPTACSPAPCSIAGNLVTWDLGTLAPGATGSRTVTVTVPAGAAFGTTFTDTAQILSAENDATPADNTSSLTTTVAFNRAPTCSSGSVTTPEDTTVATPLSCADPDGDSLTYTIVSGPTKGTLSGTAPNLTYTPNANQTGNDSFTFKASDGSLESPVATMSISITAVNDAPAAVDDSYSTGEDTTLTVAAPGVLGNDSDVDGPALTAAVVAGPSNGSLTLNPNGSFTYTPAANYNGPDSFTYQASDGSATSNTATVSITVGAANDAPAADGDTYTTAEGTSLIVAAPGVLDGDTDPEGDSLTAVLVDGPSSGTLTLNADGSFTYAPAGDFNGTDTFTYRANDGSLSSNVATVTITVTAVPDAPVAVANAYTTAEDTTLTVTAPGLLGNDTDADGDLLTAVLVDGPANGAVTVNPNGSFVYTPDADFNGSDGFTYKANDGSLDSSPATVTITVTPVADAPVAVANAYTTAEDTALTVAAPGVLGNDTDADGNALTAVLVDGPANGSLTLNPDGSFTYTPAAQFNGTDTFTYKANDGSLDSNVATVTITVDAANDAPTASDDSHATDEDTPLAVAAPGVLANDTDVDGDTLTAVLDTQPAHGTVTLNSNGSFTYTPATNYNGPDAFTYRAMDAALMSAVTTVNLTVNPVNDAPVAVGDTYVTDEDVQLNVAAPGVLGNDTDVENGSLTAVLVSGPANGTLSLNADGSFTYTPALNFNGSDSFTYRANDGTANSDVATVSITVTPVNDAPVAVNDAYAVDEDTPITVAVPGVIGNDTDVEASPLTAVLVAGPTSGTLTLNADGSFAYTPNANFNGPDSFTYRANDGTANSDVATVSITVNPVNDAPVAGDDTYTTAEDVQLNVAAPGVLGNDTDVENGSLTAVLVSGPANGTLSLNADGSFTYIPALNFNGSDSFTYRANDGAADSNVATVSITVTPVNDAPVAANDSYATNEDTPLTVAAPGVLANDTDVEASPLTAVLVAGPASGTLTLNANGSFTYTPAANYNGPDSFTYRANDGTANSDVATVSITVNPVNDAPVAANDTYTTDEDVQLNVAAPGVLGNDTDVENSSLAAVLVTGPANGTIVLNADGSFTYTPALNFNGSDSFTYRANDGAADSDMATVSITVTPVNDAPVAVNDAVTTAEDTPITVAAPGVIGNDSDVDGDLLTASLVAGPASGTLTLNANGSFTYTPNANDNGPDSFTYTVSDGSAVSNVATVAITVQAVNDAPVAAGESFATDEDTPLVVAAPGILSNDSDVDGDSLTAVVVAGPAHGTVTLNSNGSFTYTPAANYNGPDSFTYEAVDGSLSSAPATVGITVNPVNDAPTFVGGGNRSVLEDAGATTVPGWATAISAGPADEAQAVTFEVTANSNPGLFAVAPAVAPNGALSFTPVPDANGVATITVVLHDTEGGTSAPHSFTITVTAVNDAPSFTKGGDQSVLEDAGAQSVPGWATGLSTGPANESAQALSFTVANSNSALFSAQPAVSPTGALTFTPAADANGSATVTVVVKDNGGTADGGVDTSPAQDFTITVTPVNDAPSFTKGANQTVLEDAGPTTVTGWATAISKGPANESAQTLAFEVANSDNALFSTQPAISATGTLTFTPAPNANGSATVTVVLRDNGGTANGGVDASGPQTFTITVTAVNDAPTFTITDPGTGAAVASRTAEYSDPIDGVVFSASDIDSPGSALSFSVSPALNDLALGTATIVGNTKSQPFGGRLNAPAGTYTLTVTVSDGAGGSISAPLRIDVTREIASVTDFQPPALVVDGTDGDVDSLNVTMTISEVDDGNPSSTLSTPAGLANAQPVALALTPVGIGSNFSCAANNTAYVPGAQVPGPATASCTIANVTVNVYQADATIGGNHFTGGGMSAVTVYDPKAGFTTGGGQFLLPDGTKVNFGFNANYLKSKQIQGSSLTIFHRPDGNHIVKSNAMGALAVRSAQEGTDTIWAATLTGKSTYQVPTGGVLYCGTNKCGNYGFTVYVEDRKEPGAGADRYWFEVKDPNTGQPVPLASLAGTPTTAAANAVTIARGNIQIPH